jgi:hypothetical protein
MLNAAQHVIVAEKPNTRVNVIINKSFDAGRDEAMKVAESSTKSDEESKSLLAQALEVIKEAAKNAADSAKLINQVASRKRTKTEEPQWIQRRGGSVIILQAEAPSTAASSSGKGN